jgi:hypothetical protein
MRRYQRVALATAMEGASGDLATMDDGALEGVLTTGTALGFGLKGMTTLECLV